MPVPGDCSYLFPKIVVDLVGITRHKGRKALKIIPLITWINNTENLLIKEVPVTSTVVVTNDMLVMVDTGMPGNPWLEEDLVSMGYNPADFDLVINTHLHADHIGGNQLFTNARIVVSKKEWDYQIALETALQKNADPVSVLIQLGKEPDSQVEVLAKNLKHLADKYPLKEAIGNTKKLEYIENKPNLPAGFTLLSVPGHTIDSKVLLLQGEKDKALITGDALYHRSMWKKDYLSYLHYDNSLFNYNAAKLAGFRGFIIPGHDHAYNSRSGQYIITDVINI
jgi:glyoxylase-like metal-dependent hydrolase (beta-lactamase superfamily II)